MLHRVRRRRQRRTLGSLVIGAAVLGGLVGCGGSSPAGTHVAVAAPPASLGTAVDYPLPASIRNLPLTEANGTTTTLAAFQGRPVMIADFLTLCTDVCPLISANTLAMARQLQADGLAGKAALLEISVDPTRDTPARLTAYQKLYGGAQPDWTLLRASPANTAALWKFFGVEYRRAKEGKPASVDWLTHKPLTYDIQHSDALVFLDAAGHERFVVNGAANAKGNKPPAKLVQFLDGEGIDNLYKPNPVESWSVSQGLSVFSWLTQRHLSAGQQ